MSINLNNIISAISTALDLSQRASEMWVVESFSNIKYQSNKFLFHSKRTTYIALEIANELKLDERTKKRLYISSMLHDIGATDSMNKSHSSETFIKNHCLVGSSILKSFPQFKDLSNIVLYHHENWNGFGPMNLKMNDIPLESQLIRLADLIEVQYDETIPCYNQKNSLIEWVKNNSNVLFNPKIADAFLKLSRKDVFWFNIENISYIDLIMKRITPNIDIFISLEEFEEIAYIFSNIIDNTSKFTAKHSREIGELAYKISKHLGYDEEKCRKMKIAGLLHDIGKLAIPSEILSKEGALTREEFAKIKSHVYYTKVILDKIEDIPDISDWASNHHEKLNGRGYPRNLSEEELSTEARILGICDIYQALTEDRPYRKGLSKEKSFEILDSMVKENLICSVALEAVKSALNN